MITEPSRSTLFPYTTLFRSRSRGRKKRYTNRMLQPPQSYNPFVYPYSLLYHKMYSTQVLQDHIGSTKNRGRPRTPQRDRKSTRLNSSHLGISYAVFCLKKKI